MAALSDMPRAHDAAFLRLVELHRIKPAELEPVLAEEVTSWWERLDWDFRSSAALVHRFLDMHALNGFCLLHGEDPVGYAYYVGEERKGLIGDLYVMRHATSAASEYMLLDAVLTTLARSPVVHRVESQLMMLRATAPDRLPMQQYARAWTRQFMSIDVSLALTIPIVRPRAQFSLEPWSERRQDEAAALIADSYRGHVDSDINDQYRSPAGARRFLANIVQYPGCGSFFQPASFVAIDANTHKMCGMSLCSLVANEVGHITQICVSQSHQRTGIGYELLRHSLVSLAAAHCRSASLTVTSTNVEAITLYDRVGFRKMRDFYAVVWEGF
jgi:ribosomal protein S18 acetylase RimI-like enzyme